MRIFSNNRNCIISLILIVAGVLISDIIYNSDIKYRREVLQFSRKLQGLEERGRNLLEELAGKDRFSREYYEKLKRLAEKEGVSVALYRGGELVLWSENYFELPPLSKNLDQDSRFQFIHNRWVVTDNIKDKDNEYFYFVDIYNDYEIENNIMESGFAANLGLPEGASFLAEEGSGYPVYGSDGEYLLSLEFDRGETFNTLFVIIPLALLLLFFIILGRLTNSIIERLTRKRSGRLALLISVLASLFLYSLFLIFDKPDIISSLSIFKAFRYTAGDLMPSPGHMLLASMLMVYVAYSFYRWWELRRFHPDSPRKDLAVLSIYILPAALLFYLFSISLESFIDSSNISFEFYRILDIDSFSVVSFLASSLMLVILLIYLLKVMMAYSDVSSKTLFMASSPSMVFLLIIYISYGENPLYQLLTFALFLLMIRLFRNRKSVLVVITVSLSLIAGAYTAWLVSSRMWETEGEKIRVMAVNQIGNNDPLAEELLIDNWDRLVNDSTLESMMNLEFFLENDVNRIYTYLDRAYFSGYWDQYELIYTLCNWDSPLVLDTESEEVQCFDFFENRVENYGIPIIDTNLYLIDNRSGRPYYLARLFFEKGEDSKEKLGTGLFIDMISKIEYALPGYPELLKDNRYQRHSLPDDYSLAKYMGDSLVLQTGNYPFVLKLVHDSVSTGGFISFVDNMHECVVYNHSPTVSVVIARPLMRFQNILISFTYIFIIFFVLFTLALILVRPPEKISFHHLDFRQKLQYAVIILLLGSITAIGSVVILLSISQFRSKHYDNISEKLSSVYIELDHKLSTEEVLSKDWQQDAYADLDALLVKFSNVFFTDINLYSVDGYLLASSRREVFNKNLKSSRMDFRAYSELSSFAEARFIQEEKVGNLTYLSAYSPFLNYRNEVLAYLNLPYFAIQHKLSEEISNLVVTIINFSLILIVIAMGLAVFIALQITSPLRMLKEGLASVSLDSETSKLEYRGHDEISELVNQYNDMLEQLHLSAKKLARSEREDAWRDMAKQVAHEIKNPLTPMKLNVQQLLKTWEDKPEDFDKRLQKFSDNMIENIDNLSSIATEFSYFARVPQANPQEIDLVSKLRSSVELFENSDNIDIICNCSGYKEVKIFADKEQILSMLTNIIRNAVQAIPPKRQGKVEVSLGVKNNKALISVSDNGVGIAEKLGEKMFVPNFTTKSSGMGIGLALVKRIVETAGGTIWYESKLNEGTTFFIEFPILSTSGN